MRNLKPFGELNENKQPRGFVEPIQMPLFKSTGRYILASDKFWAVFVMTDTSNNTRYKTMSMEPETMVDLVNFIKGGYEGDSVSTANEIAGLFVDEAGAKKFYDALKYRAER